MIKWGAHVMILPNRHTEILSNLILLKSISINLVICNIYLFSFLISTINVLL